MFKSNFNGVTINSIFDTRRKLITGLYPVRIINYRRERRSFSTGISLSKLEWGRLTGGYPKSGHILRSKVVSSFRAKVTAWLILRGFKHYKECFELTYRVEV